MRLYWREITPQQAFTLSKQSDFNFLSTLMPAVSLASRSWGMGGKGQVGMGGGLHKAVVCK